MNRAFDANTDLDRKVASGMALRTAQDHGTPLRKGMPPAAVLPASRFHFLHLFFLPLCLTIYLISGFSFAHRQTLWLDETTQLSGLTLGPVGVTQWLAGAPHDFGYPTAPDRMPPMSYWAGQFWGWEFGFSELSLRYLGVACGAGAIVFVYAAGRRAFGVWGGLAAGMYLAVSPAVLEKSVEIRAYPLYLLLGSVVTWALVGYLVPNVTRASRPLSWSSGDPPLQAATAGETPALRRWLVALAVGMILMCYTHYIGVLGAGAILAALFLVRWRSAASVRPILYTGLSVATACLGLYPFVSAAAVVSRSGMQWTIYDRLLAVGELFSNLLFHALSFYDIWVPVLATVCGVVWLTCSLRRRPTGPDASGTLRLTLAGALGIGFTGLLVATFCFPAFKSAQYQYNLWMVPLVALLLAAATVPARTRKIVGLAILVFLVVNAWTSVRIAFGWPGPMAIAHGPDPRLAALVSQVGPDHITIFHDAGSESAAVQTYYPLCYLYGGRVGQFTHLPWEPGRFVRVDHTIEQLDPAQTPTRYALVLRSGGLRFGDFRGLPPVPYLPGPAVEALKKAGWKQLPPHPWIYRGMMRQEAWLFERPLAPPAPRP